MTTLEKHITEAKGQVKVRAALVKHLKETRRHATEMKKALASLGGSHPVFKEGVSKLGNLAIGLVTTAAEDTIVKNAIADFATEHLEIACYNSLIFTATALRETKIANTCKSILKEEKAMAKFLEGQLKATNDAYLATLDDVTADSPKENARTPSRRSGGASKGKK